MSKIKTNNREKAAMLASDNNGNYYNFLGGHKLFKTLRKTAASGVLFSGELNFYLSEAEGKGFVWKMPGGKKFSQTALRVL